MENTTSSSDDLPERAYKKHQVDANYDDVSCKALASNPWLEELTATLPLNLKNKRSLAGHLPDQDVLNKETGQMTRGIVRVYTEHTVDNATFVKIFAKQMQDVFLLNPAGHSMYMFFCYLLSRPENIRKTELRATLPMYKLLMAEALENSTKSELNSPAVESDAKKAKAAKAEAKKMALAATRAASGKPPLKIRKEPDPLKLMGQTTYYRGIKDLVLKGFISRAIVNGESSGWFFINPMRWINGNRLVVANAYTIEKEVAKAKHEERLAKTRMSQSTYVEPEPEKDSKDTNDYEDYNDETIY
jgi:hypothetical protein